MAQDNRKEFGGRTYTFGQMPATVALRVEIAVGGVIGEALFKLLAAGSDDEQQAAFGPAIGIMLTRMDPDQMLSTMKQVFAYVGYDGVLRIDNIDAAFTGRNKELWQVFAAALRFNFADFFPEKLIRSVSAAMPASS